MDNDQIETSIKTGWKILTFLGGLLFILMAAENIYETMVQYQYSSIIFFLLDLLITLLVLLFGISLLTFVFRFKTIIDSKEIKQMAGSGYTGIFDQIRYYKRGAFLTFPLFPTFNITFDEIEWIKIKKRKVKVYGNQKIITLRSSLADYSRCLEFIAEQIAGREDIKFYGQQKYIDEYFGSV